MRHFRLIFEHCCKWCKWLGLTTKTWSHLNVNHWTCPFWCSPRALFDKVLFMPIKTSTNQIHFHIQKRQNERHLSFVFRATKITIVSRFSMSPHWSHCLKIHKKSHSTLRIDQKWPICGQTVLPDMTLLKRTKIDEKCQIFKNSNETFLGNF